MAVRLHAQRRLSGVGAHGLQTLFPATPTAYFKLGLYRKPDPAEGSPEPDFILFHDDASRDIGIAVGFTRIPHL
jgi:hypothetical protein